MHRSEAESYAKTDSLTTKFFENTVNNNRVIGQMFFGRKYGHRVPGDMISEYRLNAYQIMWLFVFFDLPTTTRKERKNAAAFRKCLEKDGFTMMQYSVFIRHCSSQENCDVQIKRIRMSVPEVGMVSILAVTDKQFGGIINL